MDDEKPTWEYKPDNGTSNNDLADSNGAAKPKPAHQAEAVAWRAPEYLDHDHGAGWYLMLFVITLGLAALVYLAAKDTFAAVIIVLLGIIVGVFAAQKPQNMDYEISSSGLSLNGKLYAYSNYKSFSLMDEGELSSVNLFPIKRLMPPLSVYFDPKDEEKIMRALGDSLPYEQRGLDGIERLARRLRL